MPGKSICVISAKITVILKTGLNITDCRGGGGGGGGRGQGEGGGGRGEQPWFYQTCGKSPIFSGAPEGGGVVTNN